jgi:signal transduction histidine kinase
MRPLNSATNQLSRGKPEVIGFQLSAIKNLLDEQNASALREQFIAVLGHDLRTPLASIVGGASLLRKETLSERGSRILDMIQGSVVRRAWSAHRLRNRQRAWGRKLKSLRRPKRPLHVSDV